MIKRPFLASVSLILFLGLAYFVIERIIFINNAEHTEGTVTEIRARNSTCGGSRRRRSYSCTKFNANVKYQVTNKEYILNLSAGSARGDNRSTEQATYNYHQKINVIYNPKDPAHAYEDSIWGVWAVPIMLFFGQIVTFITSLTEPKKRS
jgi:hypothetical protein